MIPIIEDTCVEKKKWISHEDMMNVTVIAESTPGPVAINFATFVGYKKAKLLGAIAATFGVVLPSFIIIFAISLFLDNFLQIAIVAKAFKGIKIGVGVLIINAAISMIEKMRKSVAGYCILGITFLVMIIINVYALKISSIIIMLTGGVTGLAIAVIKSSFDKKEVSK